MKVVLYVVAALLALAFVALVYQWLNRSNARKGGVVIGTELAEARAKEQARLDANPARPSPMPAESYDRERGDHSLIMPAELPLDEAIRAVVHRFAKAPPEEREAMRAAISMQELYSLRMFALRSAALELNDGSGEHCRDGMIAAAMIDPERIDWRDARGIADLLACVGRHVRIDLKPLFESAIDMATQHMAENLRDAQGRRSEFSECLYELVETERGLGLVERLTDPYEPSLNLTQLGLEVHRLVNDGQYAAFLTVGSAIPSVWFAADQRERVEALLKGVPASLNVKGEVRGGKPFEQMFVIWIAELPEEDHARALEAAARTPAGITNRHVRGIASGRLFALVVARVVIQGAAPIESAESVERWSRHVAEAMRRVDGG